jgi:hypothetical protein
MLGYLPTGYFFGLMKLDKQEDIRFPTFLVRRGIQTASRINLGQCHPFTVCRDTEKIHLRYAICLRIVMMYGAQGDQVAANVGSARALGPDMMDLQWPARTIGDLTGFDGVTNVVYD